MATGIRRARTKDHDEVGLAEAISWFVRDGWTVSVPLVDDQSYDLVVDRDGRLQRVEVTTGTRRTRSGGVEVELRTNGGNRSRSTNEPLDPGGSDLLYVLTDIGRWLIPTSAVAATTSLTLGRTWEEHRLDD